MSYYGYESPNDFRNYLMHAQEKKRRNDEAFANGDRFVPGTGGYTYDARDGVGYRYHSTPQSLYREEGDTDESRRYVAVQNAMQRRVNRNGGKKRKDNAPMRYLEDGTETSESARTIRERDLERQRRETAARRQQEYLREKEKHGDLINTRRAQREAAAAQAQRIHARRQQVLAREEAVNDPGAQRAREEQERARRNRRK